MKRHGFCFPGGLNVEDGWERKEFCGSKSKGGKKTKNQAELYWMSEKSFREHLTSQLSTAHQQVKPIHTEVTFTTGERQ